MKHHAAIDYAAALAVFGILVLRLVLRRRSSRDVAFKDWFWQEVNDRSYWLLFAIPLFFNLLALDPIVDRVGRNAMLILLVVCWAASVILLCMLRRSASLRVVAQNALVGVLTAFFAWPLAGYIAILLRVALRHAL